MVFEYRRDAHYFLTMDGQEPDIRGESRDPYVVLNRWRTLLITLDAVDFCDCCEQNKRDRDGEGGVLEAELKRHYQEVDQLFAGINAFTEKAATYFEQHAQLCGSCRTLFQAGTTAAQAMQDSIFENPETPDTMWLSRSRCLDELLSPVSHHEEKAQEDEALTVP